MAILSRQMTRRTSRGSFCEVSLYAEPTEWISSIDQISNRAEMLSLYNTSTRIQLNAISIHLISPRQCQHLSTDSDSTRDRDWSDPFGKMLLVSHELRYAGASMSMLHADTLLAMILLDPPLFQRSFDLP
jgi:hypothetical protein